MPLAGPSPNCRYSCQTDSEPPPTAKTTSTGASRGLSDLSPSGWLWARVSGGDVELGTSTGRPLRCPFMSASNFSLTWNVACARWPAPMAPQFLLFPTSGYLKGWNGWRPPRNPGSRMDSACARFGRASAVPAPNLYPSSSLFRPVRKRKEREPFSWMARDCLFVAALLLLRPSAWDDQVMVSKAGTSAFLMWRPGA